MYKYQLSILHLTGTQLGTRKRGCKSCWIWSDNVWQMQIFIERSWLMKFGAKITSRINRHSSLVVTFICICSSLGTRRVVMYWISLHETHSRDNDNIFKFSKQFKERSCDHEISTLVNGIDENTEFQSGRDNCALTTRCRIEERLMRAAIRAGGIDNAWKSVFEINVSCDAWRQIGKFELKIRSDKLSRICSTRS